MMDHKLAVAPQKSRDKRTDARITKTRRALRAALLDLVTQMPFEDVTVAAITKRAGIGYATFFRHYPSREALLAEIANDLLDQLVVVITPLVLTQDSGAAASFLASFVEARRPLCGALLVGAGEAMRRDITARAMVRAGTGVAPMSQLLPHDLGIIHGVAATLNILRWWLEQDRPMDAATVADLLDRLVFRPMTTKEA